MGPRSGQSIAIAGCRWSANAQEKLHKTASHPVHPEHCHHPSHPAGSGAIPPPFPVNNTQVVRSHTRGEVVVTHWPVPRADRGTGAGAYMQVQIPSAHHVQGAGSQKSAVSGPLEATTTPAARRASRQKCPKVKYWVVPSGQSRAPWTCPVATPAHQLSGTSCQIRVHDRRMVVVATQPAGRPHRTTAPLRAGPTKPQAHGCRRCCCCAATRGCRAAGPGAGAFRWRARGRRRRTRPWTTE